VGLVHHIDRLERTDARILAFFLWWADSGPHPITIPPFGGLRDSEKDQADLFKHGASKARTLKETPHGRGGAADALPAVLDPSGRWVKAIYDGKHPEGRKRLLIYGELAEQAGLRWGGRFKPLDKDGLGWDLAHVEVFDWLVLPFPPTTH
jgi:hypothetical protein